LHKAGETGVPEPGNEKAPESKITDTANQNKNLGGPLRSRPAPMLPGEGTPGSPVQPGFMQRTRNAEQGARNLGCRAGRLPGAVLEYALALSRTSLLVRARKRASARAKAVASYRTPHAGKWQNLAKTGTIFNSGRRDGWGAR
jgi:hypothetical protein